MDFEIYHDEKDKVTINIRHFNIETTFNMTKQQAGDLYTMLGQVLMDLDVVKHPELAK